MNDIYKDIKLNIMLERLYNCMEIEKGTNKAEYKSWNISDEEMTFLLKEINPQRFEFQEELLKTKVKEVL